MAQSVLGAGLGLCTRSRQGVARSQRNSAGRCISHTQMHACASAPRSTHNRLAPNTPPTCPFGRQCTVEGSWLMLMNPEQMEASRLCTTGQSTSMPRRCASSAARASFTAWRRRRVGTLPQMSTRWQADAQPGQSRSGTASGLQAVGVRTSCTWYSSCHGDRAACWKKRRTPTLRRACPHATRPSVETPLTRIFRNSSPSASLILHDPIESILTSSKTWSIVSRLWRHGRA